MFSVSLWLSDSVRCSGISDGVATDGIEVVSDLFSACEQALKLLAAIKMAICLSDFELTGYFVWFAVSRPCRYDDITRTVKNLKLNSCEGIALFVYLDNLNPCGQLFVGDG